LLCAALPGFALVSQAASSPSKAGTMEQLPVLSSDWAQLAAAMVLA